MKNLNLQITVLGAIASVVGCATNTPQPIKNNNIPAINATWNDSGEDKSIGFWLYAAEGTCPSIREKNPIVVAPKSEKAQGESRTISVENLEYCFSLPTLDRCEIGELSYRYKSDFNQYHGSYKLKFVSGKILEGEFVAGFCPKKP